MKKVILFLMLLTFPFIQGWSEEINQITGKEISLEKIQFIVWKNSCKYIPPSLRLCQVAGKINSQSTWLLIHDDSGEIGLVVYYNSENNNIYVTNSEKDEREIHYAANMYRCHAKSKYYYIGKAKIENGFLKPLFLEGARFIHQKRRRNFFNFFDYDYLHRVYIDIPGILKPAFVSYHIKVDGEIIEVMPDR
ncbi:MAG: hypothetical protein Q8R31_06320 [Candidatus Omnitrophota bacterium]|nr:hypothetical protein [Candidatus Omnitrophota bacterium]